MNLKVKGSIIVVATLLLLSVVAPVFAQSQNGSLQHDRDQECTPQGPATRAYGEDPPVQAQEEKPELISEEIIEEDTPLQEQNQKQEQLRNCDCENEDCEKYQYRYQYRHGQAED